ncbi:MAG TPA: UvrD-helicase domain-containing protein [Candidatus Woesebacteria bacterium]|nr:UvrD-helicase domain-containing protein [Candidatus Woesebacteria bacterium]
MSNILDGLNEIQKKAVVHQGSPLLILAGAGSGKTRVLTHRAAYLVESKQSTSSEILLLTFTNKAAGEMKERMMALLGPSSKNANFFAGTFHSFCCQLLRHSGTKIGVCSNFVIYDTDDQENLVRSILNDLNLTPKEFKPSSVLYFIENAKNNYQSPSQVASVAHGFWETYATKIYSRYQEKMTKFGALDFNDLLFKTVELLVNDPSTLDYYQEKYKHILVDEYQDTNQIQYLLTKLLAKKYRQITAVGDAAQAIYGWRGADYRNLTAFTKDFADTTVVNLEQNYRSTQIILDAANAVISKNTSHPILHLFSTNTTDNLIKFYEAESEVNEADFVSERILFLINQLHFQAKDIAVLYRMNAQSRVIEESFLKYQIPYVLIGGLRFYDRAEIKDIIAMLRFANNHQDELSLARVQKALGKRRLAVFENHVNNLDTNSSTSLQLLESLVVNSGYLEKFDPREEDDQRKIENIKELKSVASSFPKLEDFLENIALVQQEYSLQEKNKKNEKRDGVRLMTLHSSKGLEFEAVFLVGVEEGILPHSRSMIEESDIEEERRLSYVGITRAKNFLYISYASRRLFFGKSSLNEPSRFLLEIPQHLIEYISEKPQKNSNELVYDPDIY